MATNPVANPVAETDDPFLQDQLYAVHTEIKSKKDLEEQRGTPIPALFNQFYKFIQNPSTVSVETFKRMVDTDETIGAGVDFLQTCLAARVGNYIHPSAEITEFVNKALEAMEGGFYNTFKDTSEATWAGFSVQEIVWKNDPELGFVPQKLVPLPPTSVLFETTRTGELTEDGILQYQRNYNPAQLGYGAAFLFGFTSSSGGYLGQPDPYARFGDFPFPIRSANTYSYLSIRIPKLKCLVYSNRAPGQFGNPYGRSLLRRCYKWWVMKDAFLRMLSVALDRKGTPLNIVYADPNQTLIDPTRVQAQGNSARQNAAQGIRSDVAAAQAFRNVHADSTIILPGKKGQLFEVQTIDQKANVEDFKSAIDMCDKAFLRALLIPSLIFTNGDGTGSFALGQEHAKTWEKILDAQGCGMKDVWLNGLIRQILMYNFPESAWKKDGVGQFTKRELTQDERQKEMDIFATAIDKGVIDPTELDDLNQMREKMGFTPRTKPIVQEMPKDPKEGDGEEKEESMV